MAKLKNKKNSSLPEREDFDDSLEATDIGSGIDQQVEANTQAAASRQASIPLRLNHAPADTKRVLDSAREFVESHPGRAALIGAVVGGAAAGLLATELGRSFLRTVWSYARPIFGEIESVNREDTH